ncbi:MAG: DUF5060 domain-containing protein [Opitutales bacterium]
MKIPLFSCVFACLICLSATGAAESQQSSDIQRLPDGNGSVEISGTLQKWHNITLTLDGPFAHERDTAPNPFVDLQMFVVFSHDSEEPSLKVPGYFAADGEAAETSAESGTKWRAHLAPSKSGIWNYKIEFEGTPYTGKTGSFEIHPSDKRVPDLRAQGRIVYQGDRYMRYADSGNIFLKAGADAPETLLAYTDFDNTETYKPGKGPLKTWEPHVRDWQEGDPAWQTGKGKGLIGAVNYLADKGVNAFSFLTYNAGGDGDNVWPHIARDAKLHFDCSKLDQWAILFEHATTKGMFLHFKLQETENDDANGPGSDQALDGGELGVERKTYLREMIARFGHNLALNWNVGEENTQSFAQSSAMVKYIRETDPYQHSVVLHTYPNQQNKRYNPYLGKADLLLGLSIQNSNVSHSHRDVLKWVRRAEESGHSWIVAMDEAGNAAIGTPPDPDWPGVADVIAEQGKKTKIPTIDDVRAEVLWGTFTAGGVGTEYYFGYRMPENDLNAQDWRSRERTWDYSRIALEFFRDNEVPLDTMSNANALVGNPENTNARYCLAHIGESYLIYMRDASQAFQLDLSGIEGDFEVVWFDPRNGGNLQEGSVEKVTGGSPVSLGSPPSELSADWVAWIRRN